MTAESPLGRLRGPRAPIAWDAPPKAPKDARTDRVWIGADPHGLGFEVAVAAWAGDSAPTLEALRSLHAGRLKSRAVPLCVALHDDRGRAWVLGPLAAAPALGPLPEAQAARLLQAALAEPTASAARARILQARDAFESAEIPGFDSQGLFAIRELTWGVPRRPDWPEASERSRAILSAAPRNSDLVRGLGFDTRDIPGNALLLTVGDDPPRAVAIMLKDDEAFDAESPRFGRSPIYHGLDVARRNNVRWLVVVRGSQLRLYPTAPDVGVGRRGATQTYFGLDLALLDDAHAGYLSLAFGGDALRPGGSADEILDASRDYAVSLGERLRDRIYADVIDRLSVAVANAVAAGGALDDDRLAFSYRLTLRVLFRLLFQAYAEDTHLLPLHRNDRYTRASLKELARDFAAHPERQNDPNSTSLWDGLQQVWRVIDKGDSAWGIPAYNGGLFGADPELHRDGAAIAGLRLSNDTIGPALAGLLVDRGPDGERGPVDFRSLDVRDFGTIYEGLLESGISLAPEDLTLDVGDAWRPAKAGEEVRVRAGDPYFHSKSGDRKATGSYFTKPFAVEHLLDRALDPALDAHLDAVAALVGKGDQVAAARRFFDFRVADLAMGSGHFLVAAIGHIEAKFGAFLERTPVPGVERELLDLADAAVKSLAQVGIETADIDRSALLGRQIARRCVYGLDINDIAVELARLAIWVRTFVPGLPMSSLDHQLVWGNSLTGIGTVQEAVEALDPDARTGAMTFSGAAISAALDGARRLLEDAAALKETTAEEARSAQDAARQAMAVAEPARLVFDAALATRLGVVPLPSEFDVDGIAAVGRTASVQKAVAELAPVHFPMAFPEVFLRERSGFDVILGNPPWEKLQIEEHSFLATYSPGLRGLDQAHAEAALTRIRADRPDVVAAYEAATRQHQLVAKALAAGPYPGLGAGRPDLYKAFAWRYLQLLRPSGRLGVVLPWKAIEASGMKEWRRAAFQDFTVSSATIVANKRHWVFDSIHEQTTILFLAMEGSRSSAPTIPMWGPYSSLADFVRGLEQAPVIQSVDGISSASAGTAVPMLASQDASEVFAVIRQAGPLTQALPNRAVRGLRELNASDDKHLLSFTPAPGLWPVYKGESFDIWNPDTGRYYAWIKPEVAERFVLDRAENMRNNRRSAFFGQGPAIAEELASHPLGRARVAWRDSVNRDNQRTFIVALVPPRVALVHQAFYLFPSVPDPRGEAYLLGVLSSIPFDWFAKQSVERHALVEWVNNAPIPAFSPSPAAERLIELAATAASNDNRFAAFADACDVGVGGLGDDREDLLAEMDALVCVLYGLRRPHIEHIYRTFHPAFAYEARLQRVLAYVAHWGASHA